MAALYDILYLFVLDYCILVMLHKNIVMVQMSIFLFLKQLCVTLVTVFCELLS